MFVNCRVFRWFGAGWRARLQILWISNEKLQEASGRRARVTHLDKTLADEAKFGRNIFLNQRTGLIWGPPTTMRGDMEWKSIFKVHNFAPRAKSIFSKAWNLCIFVLQCYMDVHMLEVLEWQYLYKLIILFLITDFKSTSSHLQGVL